MSEPTPWIADRELSTELARAAIREAIPELAEAAVERLGNGWDFDAYVADARFVFRFPRREACQAWLRKDLALLPWVADRVALPVPRYGWGPLRAHAFPYEFSGYELLEGDMAANLEPEDGLLKELGTQLGVFFRSLHDLRPPEDLIVEAGLDRPLVDPGPLRDHMRSYLPKFLKHLPHLTEPATRFFDDTDHVPAPYDGPPCLVHADLHAEHLLLDAEDPRRITGVIDWSDARVSDPARDFACIYSWGGETILAAMLASYDSDDPTLETRSRFLGTCFSFMDWSWWIKVGRARAAKAAESNLERALGLISGAGPSAESPGNRPPADS